MTRETFKDKISEVNEEIMSINSDIKLENAIELIKIRTKQFAKRQRTWLRKDSEINWFDKFDDLITFSTKYGTS